MAPGKPDNDGHGDGDAVAALSAIYDDTEPVTDLPRSPWTPTREALADGDRRIAARVGGVWSNWVQQTIAMAARIRAAEPGSSWPVTTATTRLDLCCELEKLRPGLLATPCAREVAEDTVLAALVDACAVIDYYQRAITTKK